MILQTEVELNLAEIEKNVSYIVKDINCEDGDLRLRLFAQLIYPGQKIRLIRSAPIFKDPMIFEVDSSQLVISKDQAALITVEQSLNDE